MKAHTDEVDERRILESYERGEWRTVKDLKGKGRLLRTAARNTLQKDKSINIRMSSRDLNQVQVNATSYEAVMSSGENAPVIIPGDVDNSLLAQYLLGSNGKLMPPFGALPEESIQSIMDWIEAGAENN